MFLVSKYLQAQGVWKPVGFTILPFPPKRKDTRWKSMAAVPPEKNSQSCKWQKETWTTSPCFFFAFAIIVQKHSPQNSQLAGAIGPKSRKEGLILKKKHSFSGAINAILVSGRVSFFLKPRLCSFFLGSVVPSASKAEFLSQARRETWRYGNGGLDIPGETKNTRNVSPFFSRGTPRGWRFTHESSSAITRIGWRKGEGCKILGEDAQIGGGMVGISMRYL